MAWLYLIGIIVLALLFLAVHSFGDPEQPRDDDEDPEQGPYRWGDELHEYSYRHPWDDEL